MHIHRLKSRILIQKRHTENKTVSAALLLHFSLSDLGCNSRSSMMQHVVCRYEEGMGWQDIKARLIEKGWQQLEQYFAGLGGEDENIFAPEPLKVSAASDDEHRLFAEMMTARKYNRLMWQYIFVCCSVILALFILSPSSDGNPDRWIRSIVLLLTPVLGLQILKAVALRRS